MYTGGQPTDNGKITTQDGRVIFEVSSDIIHLQYMYICIYSMSLLLYLHVHIHVPYMYVSLTLLILILSNYVMF